MCDGLRLVLNRRTRPEAILRAGLDPTRLVTKQAWLRGGSFTSMRT
eukprot:COSAG01_NODE_2950_length_6804_cov_89.553318_6_plen_46_part_00